eukprot:scaffold2065_cov359-Prasinococcus_capsulatus_cf.AAC.7
MTRAPAMATAGGGCGQHRAASLCATSFAPAAAKQAALRSAGTEEAAAASPPASLPLSRPRRGGSPASSFGRWGRASLACGAARSGTCAAASSGRALSLTTLELRTQQRGNSRDDTLAPGRHPPSGAAVTSARRTPAWVPL